MDVGSSQQRDGLFHAYYKIVFLGLSTRGYPGGAYPSLRGDYLEVVGSVKVVAGGVEIFVAIFGGVCASALAVGGGVGECWLVAFAAGRGGRGTGDGGAVDT